MNLITNRLLSRFGPTARLADAAIVGGAALKFAQRKGLVSDETAKKFGATDSAAGSSLSIGELVLVVLAATRLLRHFTKKKDQVTVIEV